MTDNIEVLLGSYLPEKKGYQKTIYEAMEYSYMAGGKRLRPRFMMEVYKMFGGDDEKLVGPFMAALEMIHTYSLIHDDLPAMDDDDLRRGRKTSHIVYGEAMAILAGDALLNYAYETAAKAFDISKDEKVIKAYRVLARKAGVYGMVGGQVVDVERDGVASDEEMLRFIYELKTAALLEAAFMIGGILAGADDETVKMLENIASDVGIAFQIQDDILDVTGDADVIGKPVNSDEKNNKTTFVSFVGLEKSKELVNEYSIRAISLLEQLKGAGDVSAVKDMITDLINRDR